MLLMLITVEYKDFEFSSEYQDASSPTVDTPVLRPLTMEASPAVAYTPTMRSAKDKAGVELLGPKALQARPRQKRADPIAKFSEATRVDQAQTQRESDQHHEERMAKIAAKRVKEEMKHARKLAELELRKAELALQAPHLAYSPSQHTLGLSFHNGLPTPESQPGVFMPSHSQ